VTDRSRRALLATAAIALLALAGCGSSSSSNSKATVKATPVAYVGDVCTAVGAWLRSVQSGSNDIAKQLAPGSTPSRAKQALESLLGNSVADSQTIVRSLEAAGVPEVPNGATISEALVHTFRHAAEALEHVRTEVTQLPTSNPHAFLTATNHVSADVRQSLSGIASGLSPLRSPALQKASESSPSCKTITAG
jgi:hypothetical protein